MGYGDLNMGVVSSLGFIYFKGTKWVWGVVKLTVYYVQALTLLSNHCYDANLRLVRLFREEEMLQTKNPKTYAIWVVLKIMVPFWIPIRIRHLIFRVHQKRTIILTATYMLNPETWTM